MEERTNRDLIKIPLLMIAISLIGVFVMNKTRLSYISSIGFGKILSLSVGDTSSRRFTLTDINNNITSFNAGFSKNVHVLLSSSESKNIKDGLKFDIINPKGEIVDSGILYDGKRVTGVYKGMAGEWKVILYFEDNTASSMIDFGYSVTSNREKTWR